MKLMSIGIPAAGLRRNGLLLSLFVLLLWPGISRAEIRLPRIFQDNMVLQRDQEVRIWGIAAASEKIHLEFKHKTYSTEAGKDGKWEIKLPPQPAGGPWTLVLQGENTLSLKNVLFGDVWICSGQSNMQFTIDQIAYREKDTAAATNPQLRLFTAGFDIDFVPKDDLAGGSWQEASVETMKHFSAVAWFFGRYLVDTLQVPIGLVSVNLGASSAEAWMSPEALSAFPQFGAYHAAWLAPGKSMEEITRAFEKQKDRWARKHYLKGPGLEEEWFRPETDVSAWKTMTLPAKWEDQGLPEFDGAVWFRKEFDLPEDFNGDTYWLRLAQIDDHDIAWVNGQKIGETYGNLNWRNYAVPAKLLKPKNNVLVLRVFDQGGDGGIRSGSIWWDATLQGAWLYKPGLKIDPKEFRAPKVANASPFTSPSGLFHGNIAPLTNFAVKGVIWYQGESNASRAGEYQELFPALIQDWRKQWNRPDLPFLFVQLANYLPESAQPEASDWAELREAQALALALPYTGMAVAIDIGEAYDIHPRNKWDVGKRLGLAALQVAYKKPVLAAGPTYDRMEVRNDTIVIHYKHTGKGLVTRDKYGYVRGFAIAGEDRKFHWARAWIRGNTIHVFSEQVSRPVAVRYAWANNPGPLDLYNKEGLPAAPFRTDAWPGNTDGKEFSEAVLPF